MFFICFGHLLSMRIGRMLWGMTRLHRWFSKGWHFSNPNVRAYVTDQINLLRWYRENHHHSFSFQICLKYKLRFQTQRPIIVLSATFNKLGIKTLSGSSILQTLSWLASPLQTIKQILFISNTFNAYISLTEIQQTICMFQSLYRSFMDFSWPLLHSLHLSWALGSRTQPFCLSTKSWIRCILILILQGLVLLGPPSRTI